MRTSKGTDIPLVPTPTSTDWAAGHFRLGLGLQPYHTQHVHKHTGILGTPNHLHHWMAVHWGCVSLFLDEALTFRAALFDCEDCFSADVWLVSPRDREVLMAEGHSGKEEGSVHTRGALSREGRLNEIQSL